MADDKRVEILMSVDFDDRGTLKEIAALRAETAALRKEQKELDTTTEEGAVKYEQLGIRIKQNNTQIAALTKTIVNAKKARDAEAGSIDRLAATLSIATAAYNKLGEEGKKTAEGMRLKKIVSETTEALKAQRKEIGDNRMNVGNYAGDMKEAGIVTETVFNAAVEQTQFNLRELKTTLRELEGTSFAGKTSEQIDEIKMKIAETKAAIDDLREEFKALDTGEVFSNIVEGINVAVAATTVLSNALAAAGVESEALERIQGATVQLIATMQALSVITEYLEKQKIKRLATNAKVLASTVSQTLADKVATAQLKQQAVAESGSTLAKIKAAAATKIVTAAQWLWNAAVSANPIAAFVVAVAALTAGIAALVSWLGKESEASKEVARAEAAYDAQVKASAELRNRAALEGEKRISDRMLAGRKEIEELRRNGADEATLMKARALIDREVSDAKLENLQRVLAADEAEKMALVDAIATQEQNLQTLKKGKKAYNEQVEKIEELRSAYQSLSVSVQASLYEIANGYQQQIEQEREVSEKLVDEQIRTFDKLVEEQRKNAELRLKAEAGYQSKDLLTRQEYAQRLFRIGQDAEQKKLDNLRKQNRITEAEYRTSLERMRLELQAFASGQATELNEYWVQQRNAILGLLNQTVDEQIEAVRKKYADARKELTAIDAPVRLEGESDTDYSERLSEYEAFALQRARLAVRLQQQEDEEVAALRKSDFARLAKSIEDATAERYADDLLKYQNNEAARLEILRASLEEQKAAKMAAGLDVAAEEAALENLSLQQTALNLNRDLLLAGKNAKARFDAKKKALESEREIYAGNADEQLRIDQELFDAQTEQFQARLEAAEQWAGAVSSVFGAVNGLFNARADAELQKITETYDAEQQALDQKHEKGLLSDAEYDKQSLALQQKREKEEAKIEREKAIRDRAGKVFSIVTDTAMGIAKAVGSSPLTGGLPWSAIVAAVGALQLATVLSEPLPKAARGGIVGGRLHSGGGTIIEAERGEGIINRKSMQMFGPIVSAINELGGGVPFTRPFSDGGYTARRVQDKPLSVEDLTEAISNIQVVTYVEDINREQGIYNRIQTSGTLPG